MAKLKEFLRGPGGKVVALVAIVLGVVVIYFNSRGLIGESSFASDSRNRIFIDSENGKSFEHRLQAGDVFPIESPFTHKKTGYPAELCYWTKEGKTKTTPTPVLLNQYVNKKGPTFCPDCGRRVVSMNPIGVTPPPTEEEFRKNRGAATDDRKDNDE